MTVNAGGTSWRELPRVAKLYAIIVVVTGSVVFLHFSPDSLPKPVLFATLLVIGCVMSTWKVTLPIELSSGSTLSVSYAADLMALLVLGPRLAMIIAVAGVIAQCTVNVKQKYLVYRTVFSAAAEAITMGATALVYEGLGGSVGSVVVLELAKPLVGAIGTYFCVNTGLVAAAIGLSTRRSVWRVWRDDFLWSGASFMVAASAGACAAVVIDRGEVWPAVLMLAPVYVAYRTYQLFVGRLDLLERERSARTSAEQANRLKDQFLAIVSHELRTPLNAVLGWADILRRGGLEPDRQDRAFRAIYDGARRQALLIDELLDVSRIMSGKLRLELSPEVDVQDAVAKALEMVQPAADAKRIQIVTDARGSIGTICADSCRVQQIVWNLLTNAIKFSFDGGAIRIRIRREPTTVEISVTDGGQGISHDFLPFVFESFRQADAATTRRQGGLGLGLSIVKHLVEAHGGSVRAESAGEGQGATFLVRLPIVAVCATPAEAAAASLGTRPIESPDEPVASLNGLSVLVVDDDEESRAIVAEYLSGQQAHVLTAASAVQAFDVLRRQHVDVLLADIAMPEEDGYSLIRQIRASASGDTATIPAAALTSFARDEDRQHALEAGFHLHVAKPVDPRRLVEAITALRRERISPRGFPIGV
ncbi:MAG TPA: ATP-binding protein [Vicinamibacterales bacterium]|nr:ATP-binding protein [Vicinamibacterales bacterium]